MLLGLFEMRGFRIARQRDHLYGLWPGVVADEQPHDLFRHRRARTPVDILPEIHVETYAHERVV